MKYTLMLDTDNFTSFSTYPHTREGLNQALDRVDKVRSRDGFKTANIISDRDGEVFVLDMALAINPS
jgi:hypothetical protein